MTLADLLNTLESADMLRIIKGGEEMFVGYLSSRCRLVVPKPQQQKPENKFAKYAN